MAYGKEVIYVSGFYEHKQPFMRKAIYSTRMESEVVMTESGEGRSEKAQASRETEGDLVINEDVNHVNEEIDIGRTLHLALVTQDNQESIPSQLSPAEIQESMDTSNNEGIAGLTEDLIPLGVTTDNLFEIQIAEIDANIARFNGESVMKGNTRIALNANFTPSKTRLAHINPLITCKLVEVFTMGIPHGNSCSSSQRKPRNPKRTRMKQARKKATGSKTQSAQIGGKRVGLNHHELPLKRSLVSKDDGSSSISMVEVEHQPR